RLEPPGLYKVVCEPVDPGVLLVDGYAAVLVGELVGIECLRRVRCSCRANNGCCRGEGYGGGGDSLLKHFWSPMVCGLDGQRPTESAPYAACSGVNPSNTSWSIMP